MTATVNLSRHPRTMPARRRAAARRTAPRPGQYPPLPRHAVHRGQIAAQRVPAAIPAPQPPRSAHRRRCPIGRAAVALAALLSVGGCASFQPRHQLAHRQAEQRWNAVRADVKAQLAAEQLAAGHIDSAAAELTKAQQLDPDNPALLLLQGRVLLARGESDDALRVLETIPPDAPQAAEAAYLRGVVHQQRLQWDQAYQCFAEAADRDPREVAYVSALVQVLLQKGSPEDALALLRSFEPRFGWTPAYQAALAECHEQRGDWAAAAAAWRRVVTDDSDAALSERLALAALRAGEWSEAAGILQRLLSDAAGQRGPALRLALAECLLELNRPGEVGPVLQPLLREDPYRPAALRLLARSLAAQQEFDRARRLAEQAVHLAPQDTAALELAAALSYRLGDRRRAAELAERCLHLAPADQTAETAREILRRCGLATTAAESSSHDQPVTN